MQYLHKYFITDLLFYNFKTKRYTREELEELGYKENKNSYEYMTRNCLHPLGKEPDIIDEVDKASWILADHIIFSFLFWKLNLFLIYRNKNKVYLYSKNNIDFNIIESKYAIYKLYNNNIILNVFNKNYSSKTIIDKLNYFIIHTICFDILNNVEYKNIFIIFTIIGSIISIMYSIGIISK